MSSSQNFLEMICIPIGKLFFEISIGIDAAGCPEKFAKKVSPNPIKGFISSFKTSFSLKNFLLTSFKSGKQIVVGLKITSYLSKTFSKDLIHNNLLS